jgi:hypothetical protein
MGLDNRTCFLVNLRDGLRCQHCGKHPQAAEAQQYHRGFEYHHIVPKSAGGSDSPENITLLCRACHQGQHARKPLAPVQGQAPPKQLICLLCQTVLDSRTVEMNCGWYRCSHCQETVHLYRHFWGDLPE